MFCFATPRLGVKWWFIFREVITRERAAHATDNENGPPERPKDAGCPFVFFRALRVVDQCIFQGIDE